MRDEGPWTVGRFLVASLHNCSLELISPFVFHGVVADALDVQHVVELRSGRLFWPSSSTIVSGGFTYLHDLNRRVFTVGSFSNKAS